MVLWQWGVLLHTNVLKLGLYQLSSSPSPPPLDTPWSHGTLPYTPTWNLHRLFHSFFNVTLLKCRRTRETTKHYYFTPQTKFWLRTSEYNGLAKTIIHWILLDKLYLCLVCFLYIEHTVERPLARIMHNTYSIEQSSKCDG